MHERRRQVFSAPKRDAATFQEVLGGGLISCPDNGSVRKKKNLQGRNKRVVTFPGVRAREMGEVVCDGRRVCQKDLREKATTFVGKPRLPEGRKGTRRI